jgi:hypothetical protein
MHQISNKLFGHVLQQLQVSNRNSFRLLICALKYFEPGASFLSKHDLTLPLYDIYLIMHYSILPDIDVRVFKPVILLQYNR